MQQLLMLLLLLLQLLSYSTTLSLNTERKSIACRGVKQGDLTIGDPVTHVRNLRSKLSGCRFVMGDLTLMGLKEKPGMNLDFSFLEQIEEVTGCLNIIDVVVKQKLNLTKLRAIRGNCNKRYALVVVQLKEEAQQNWLDISGLTFIGQRNVSISDKSNCNLFKQIDFSELFQYKNQSVVRVDSNCKDKSTTCHSSCMPWLNSSPPRCWGPDSHQCQQRTRCHKNPQFCPGRSCFLDGSGQEQCCSHQCIGGCSGSGPNRCSSCRGFNKNGSCVDVCSARNIYDPHNAILNTEKTNSMAHGPVCVSECPEGFFIEQGNCVSKCSNGMSANEERICKRVSQSDNVCHLVGSATLLCSWNNSLIAADQKKLCTEYNGHISINDVCFEKSSEFRKLSIEELYFYFSRLRKIKGAVSIISEKKFLTNLTFLSSLEVIEGNSKENAVIISSPFIEFFGFKSLKRISGKVVVHSKNGNYSLCPALFPTEKAINNADLEVTPFDWKPLQKLLQRIRAKEGRSTCPLKQQRCHEQCVESLGCWGPSAEMCVRCRSQKAARRCVSACSEAGSWYSLPGDANCKRCHQLCASCHSASDSNCTSCVQDAFLNGSRCVLACDAATQFADASRTCRRCPDVCVEMKNGAATCSGNTSVIGQGGCQFCTKLLLAESRRGDHKLHCISDCPSGHYAKILPVEQLVKMPAFSQLSRGLLKRYVVSLCEPCSSHCASCSASAEACTTCRWFRVLDRTSDSTQAVKCHRSREPACPSGFVPDMEARVCHPCPENCATCSPDRKCLRCLEPAFTVLPALQVASNASSVNTSISLSTSISCVTSCPSERQFAYRDEEFGMVCTANSRVTAASILWQYPPVTFGVALLCLLVILVLAAIIAYWYCHCTLQEKNRRHGSSSSKVDEDMQLLSETCDAAAPSVAAVLHIISEKELLRGQEIGAGAFGTVYRGKWIPDPEAKLQNVAIKILSDQGDVNLSDELLEESHIMASVDHPHCVQLIGICMTQPLQLITRFMPLGNLRDFLRARKDSHTIGSAHLLTYSCQIANGMAYLEARNIIHRDLACRNVLVASTKCVKITDFGLARLLETPDAVYNASGGKLPVKWLALECLLSRRFSHKSDVWAYGVTLWEIFSFGDAPYPNIRPADLADHLEKGERLPQPSICTLDVYMIMIKCWMLNEMQRPSFDSMEGSFNKMLKEPGRYVYIRGDRCTLLSSSDSASSGAKSPISADAAFSGDDGAVFIDDGEEFDCIDEYTKVEPAGSTSSPPASPPTIPRRMNGDCTAKPRFTSSATTATTSVPASASTSASAMPASPSASAGGSKTLSVSSRRSLTSQKDNSYTTDPCTDHKLQHQQQKQQQQQQQQQQHGNGTAVVNKDYDYSGYLRPISGYDPQLQQQQSEPHVVQNPEYFFNSSRHSYANVPAVWIQNFDASCNYPAVNGAAAAAAAACRSAADDDSALNFTTV